MKISLDAKTLRCNDAQRNAILRLLRYALSRYGRELSQVRVDGKAINSPRYVTAKDQVCRIRVTLNDGTIVAAYAEGADLLAAAARTADRLGRAVGRAIDRIRMARAIAESPVDPRSGRLTS